MIVGFLADKIPYEARRGLGIYSYQLLKALLSIDTNNTYHCFYNFLRRGKREHILDVPGAKLKNIVWRLPGKVIEMMWERWRLLTVEDVFGKVDVFHSPYEILPRVKSAKVVVTVHDISPITHPECFEPKYVQWFTRRIHHIVEQADRIIVVSENTKRELVEFTSLPQEKVVVVHNGVDDRFSPFEDRRTNIVRTLQRYGISGPYVLFVGAVDEDKNLVRLAKAFAQVREEHTDLQLVFAGKSTWGYQRLKEQLADLKIDKGLVFTDFVPNDDLPMLYAGARVHAIPSIHEGFGIPALEAMACGTPVLSSNTASLPEVVGDAGLLVDPYSVDEIVEGLRRLLADEALRSSCIEKGLARSKLFSWPLAAKRVIEIYQDLER